MNSTAFHRHGSAHFVQVILLCPTGPDFTFPVNFLSAPAAAAEPANSFFLKLVLCTLVIIRLDLYFNSWRYSTCMSLFHVSVILTWRKPVLDLDLQDNDIVVHWGHFSLKAVFKWKAEARRFSHQFLLLVTGMFAPTLRWIVPTQLDLEHILQNMKKQDISSGLDVNKIICFHRCSYKK